MSCVKYTIFNTGTTVASFNYQKCENFQWEYDVEIEPQQIKNIWLVDGTFSIPQYFEQTVSVEPSPEYLTGFCDTCNPQYTWVQYNSTTCYAKLFTPATPPQIILPCLATGLEPYSINCAQVYQQNFDLCGTGNVIATLCQPNLWRNDNNGVIRGPLNRTGNWATYKSGTMLPLNKWIGYSTCLTGALSGKTYYLGIGGDNAFKVTLNGTTILDTSAPPATWFNPNPSAEVNLPAFTSWHIYPITIYAGQHQLNIFGLNRAEYGSIGCEIYNNTLAEIQSATNINQLNRVFNSAFETTFTVAQNFDGSQNSSGYTCPTGYVYSRCTNNCVKTLFCQTTTVTPTPTPTSPSNSCGNTLVPPTTYNGITVTTGGTTGDVTIYPSSFSSCNGAVITPPNAIWLGKNYGNFELFLNFSSPVNNITFVLTATGHLGNEYFTVETDVATPTISSFLNCCTTINGNVITSGAGCSVEGGGGGGYFTVQSPTPYSSLIITGPGLQNGSIFALCANSFPSVTPTPTPSFGISPTPTPTLTLTQTPTITPTITPTNTVTNTPSTSTNETPTPTSSQTPTITPTNTVTNTPSTTNNVTPTPTSSQTPTQTPTQTPANTETPTQTPTQTPANTETPTQTPTQTPANTETPTQTPTPTNTETPTNTPTQTPTNTTTQTPTNTETPTPTQTPTNTNTPTVTPCNCQALKLGFDVTTCNTACSDLSGSDYYVCCDPLNLTTGCTIYTDISCSTPAITGFYSDVANGGTNCYTVSGGVITFISVCPSPTPTPTATETPTPTQTETPTQTPTNTETPTPTQTETPTQTPTNTQTPTQTPTPTKSFNTGTVYLANSDGATCASSNTITLYWSPNLDFTTGTPLFTDSSLSTCWTNVSGYNVMSLGSGSYEFYTLLNSGCYEVGSTNGIQC